MGDQCCICPSVLSFPCDAKATLPNSTRMCLPSILRHLSLLKALSRCTHQQSSTSSAGQFGGSQAAFACKQVCKLNPLVEDWLVGFQTVAIKTSVVTAGSILLCFLRAVRRLSLASLSQILPSRCFPEFARALRKLRVPRFGFCESKVTICT